MPGKLIGLPKKALDYLMQGQADGALPNGTRIRKIAEDPDGDVHPIGSLGTVLASHDVSGVEADDVEPKPTYGYIVRFDVNPIGFPGEPTWVLDYKVEKVYDA